MSVMKGLVDLGTNLSQTVSLPDAKPKPSGKTVGDFKYDPSSVASRTA